MLERSRRSGSRRPRPVASLARPGRCRLVGRGQHLAPRPLGARLDLVLGGPPHPLLALLGLGADPLRLGLQLPPRRAPAPSRRPRLRPSRPACGPAPRPRGARPRCPASPAPRSRPRAGRRAGAPPRPRASASAARCSAAATRRSASSLACSSASCGAAAASLSARFDRLRRSSCSASALSAVISRGERLAVGLGALLRLLEGLLGAIAGLLGARRPRLGRRLRFSRSAAIRSRPSSPSLRRVAIARCLQLGADLARLRASALATRSSLTRTHSSACLATSRASLRSPRRPLSAEPPVRPCQRQPTTGTGGPLPLRTAQRKDPQLCA